MALHRVSTLLKFCHLKHGPVCRMSTVERKLAEKAEELPVPAEDQDREPDELEDPTLRSSRSMGLESMRIPITNEVQMSRENHRKQHLQPGSLPSYFESHTDFSTIELSFERISRY